MRSLAAALALIFAAPVLAGEQADWRAVDAETGQIRDIDGLEQLARDFPDSGNVRLRMLQPYLQASETEKVMATLEWLYDRGYVFSEVAQAQIPKLLGGVDAGRIAERLRAKAEVIEVSELFATAPAQARLLESVLPDLDSGRIIATSVVGRELWGMAPDGNWRAFAVSDADNLSGISFDTNKGRLWIASRNIDGSDRNLTRKSGLVSPSFEQGEDLWVAAPDGVNLSEVHAASDGTIYASDPLGGGVYRKPAGASELETLVAPGVLRSPQGLTTSEDGERLYVSDYRYGIAIIDLASGSVSRLAANLPLILDGVDGMWRYGNELIVVQNGTSPMRIAALELSEDGPTVTGLRVLEQAHSEWTEPLGGSLGKGALYYKGRALLYW